MKSAMLSRFNKHVNIFQSKLFIDSSKEGFAYNLLGKFLPKKYFPITGSSLQFNSLVAVVNDIVVNNRKSYIEFGSGISTIVIAKLAQINNLELKVTSIDHDEKWIVIVRNYLEYENIQNVEFIHAPLTETNLSIENNLWYNTETLDRITKNKIYDVVLIDGPLAYRKDIQYARYPAIPYMQSKLNKTHSIFLDDTNRFGEKHITKLWDKNYNTNFKKISNSFSYSINGDGYNFL